MTPDERISAIESRIVRIERRYVTLFVFTTVIMAIIVAVGAVTLAHERLNGCIIRSRQLNQRLAEYDFLRGRNRVVCELDARLEAIENRVDDAEHELAHIEDRLSW